MNAHTHAQVRAQQRPPLVEEWLDAFGEECYDGRGARVKYFSRRALERTIGRGPVRKMAEYLDAYKVESVADGCTITLGHRYKRIRHP